MNARFFYAAPVFTNSPKLLVLTEDSVLYSEHRDFEVVRVERQTGFNFSDFDLSEHETEDYPIVLEISYEEAREMPLNGQPNWIDRYAAQKNINVHMALQA
jgi:hypothetical protein